MTKTHTNAYRQDVDDAFVKVQQSLSAYKEANEALAARLEEDRTEDEPAQGEPASPNYPEQDQPKPSEVGPGSAPTDGKK